QLTGSSGFKTGHSAVISIRQYYLDLNSGNSLECFFHKAKSEEANWLLTAGFPRILVTAF
ncbi:MAG: hypothetical protein K8S62_08080, partial [Candidatus Sabulitectum sp.]|nr:hypothetical protein [Candidatus Sabulitectum sp.]